MANGQRPRPAIWLLLAFLLLGIVGQAVPLYTDWLWFHEVGYAQVFTTVLTLRGWLVLGLGLAVWIFLFANLWIAARTAPPDVLWELEDQLGLPGRAIIEPLVRRFLVPVTAVIAFISGARASAAWDTLIEYLNATSFGRVDPLFGRDLGFYFFELPFWRLLYGWGITLAAGTLVLTAAVYVLQRSLVLTARGRDSPPLRARTCSPSGRCCSSCAASASGSTASTSSTRAAGPSSAPPTRTSTRPCPYTMSSPRSPSCARRRAWSR